MSQNDNVSRILKLRSLESTLKTLKIFEFLVQIALQKISQKVLLGKLRKNTYNYTNLENFNYFVKKESYEFRRIIGTLLKS